MKLFAKKPCSFNGKKFFIGDEIPIDHVLDPKAQEKMGVLVVVEGDNDESAGLGEGGPLLPPSSTLEKEPYTKSALSRMSKEELLTIAADEGAEATETMKKDEIVSLIMEKQGD